MRHIATHRTASRCERSARYTEMDEDFYIPKERRIKGQSKLNKQGSGEGLEPETQKKVVDIIKTSTDISYKAYRTALALGVSRETARGVLPMSIYTYCVWKMDLHNFFKFLSLRTAEDVQEETRDYALAMHELAEPHFPYCFDAYRECKKIKTCQKLTIK